jgi:hypothetical protein
MNSMSCLRHAQSVAAAGLLLVCGVVAHAADTYSAGQLAIPTLTNGPVTYSDVVVTLGGITSGPSGTAAITNADSFDMGTGQITIPAVQVGATTFFNAAVTVARLISIGSVSGADSYNGTDLTISYVQVGNSFFRNAIVTVNAIVSIAGGMPTAAWDTYNGSNGQLTIPAVQVGARVFTNVTVQVKGVVSVGTVQGIAQTITYTAPTAPFISVGSSTPISATTNGGLPVTFVVTTPQTCAVVANSAQLQNFFVAYAGSGFGGNLLLSGVPVDTNIFEIDAVSGSLGGHPIGMLPTSNAGTFNGIPYPVFTSADLAYDNIFYATGAPNMDRAGLGMQVSGTEFNLYFVSGLSYLYTNDVISNQSPPYISITSFFAAEVDGLVGLADGTCNVIAFQNGNYNLGTGFASATPALLSIPVDILLP